MNRKTADIESTFLSVECVLRGAYCDIDTFAWSLWMQRNQIDNTGNIFNNLSIDTKA